MCAAMVELQRKDLMPHDIEVSTIKAVQRLIQYANCIILTSDTAVGKTMKQLWVGSSTGPPVQVFRLFGESRKASTQLNEWENFCSLLLELDCNHSSGPKNWAESDRCHIYILLNKKKSKANLWSCFHMWCVRQQWDCWRHSKDEIATILGQFLLWWHSFSSQ